ncbi:MAG: hypothetical protein O7G31_14380 [Calditrichaeota bacterium]|nr:hypothetical protein [Calditrichota bacterium]
MNDNLPTYTFLPWLRQGMASQIETTDTLGAPSSLIERAGVTVRLRVNDRPHLPAKNVQLIGPGDVIGINPRAVVKTEPRNWITDFEANYLPFIEFADEDFAWRYTPAKATDQHRLRPWIFLLVLSEEEYNLTQPGPAPLPMLSLKIDGNAFLPKTSQTWAWAHVHVNKDVTDESNSTPSEVVDALESLVRKNPDEASCRLMCPRKLQPNTAYHAFLIPTFETGRRAGLGLPTGGVDALKGAWGDGQSEFPVYYQWYFRTGERGNFEFLANLLEPGAADERVGIRDMDMQQPNYEVTGLSGELAVMGLEGALKSPSAEARPTVWPSSPLPDFVKELKQKVNLLHEAEKSGHPDPIVSPPLYGRWHAKAETLDIENEETAPELAGWVNQLNGDPRNRVPAGFGTKVIQTNQEKYKQASWRQLGAILEVNQKIRLVQFALPTSFRIFQKSILPLANDQLISITQSTHSRIIGNPKTIFQKVKESKVTSAAASPALRKIVRPRGTLIKKALPQSIGKPESLISQINAGDLTTASPKIVSKNQVYINDAAEKIVPAWIPDWLLNLSGSTSARRIILGTIALLLLLGLLVGFVPLIIVGLVVGGAVFATMLWVARQVEKSESVKEENLTTEAVRNTPQRPNFKVTEPGDEPSGEAPPGEDSEEAANFRAALMDMHVVLETPIAKPAIRPVLDLTQTVKSITKTLNPVHALTKRTLRKVVIPATFDFLRPTQTIVTVMAHPSFADPMYKPLRDLSAELLIPNLNLIPNNTVSLLETNRDFIESYMVGLNHEMARELLWSRFPTDQRGSYFRQFWDVSDFVNRENKKTAKEIEESLRDIKPIHEWRRPTDLGSHENRPLPAGGDGDEARLVLVVRGDLLKKYPTTMVFAQKAKWGKDEFNRDVRIIDEDEPAEKIEVPIFKAEIEPDLKFLGFNLTANIVKGSKNIYDGDAGWFFVFQEAPGEPRFGLDVPSNDQVEPPQEWKNVSWAHLTNFETLDFVDLEENIPTTPADSDNVDWGENAADQAYILYRVPVMVAFHAVDMLK